MSELEQRLAFALERSPLGLLRDTARFTAWATARAMEGTMTRQTCEMCVHWTRDKPLMGEPVPDGICDRDDSRQHEASMRGDCYEPLAEADTDPAPGWYCDVCGQAQPANERPDDGHPDRCDACWLQAELWAAGRELCPSRRCPFPWCRMGAEWTPENCVGCNG
jgi:hypothetical protein